MKQTVTNTQITDKEFTINDIPAIIDDNQFYCFNPKTGTVRIGEIIGKSALRSETRYKLGHFEFKDYRTLSNDNPILTFRINSLIKNVKAYKNYQDFIKEYNEFITEKLKRKKNQKIKYIVSLDTFVCKTTKAAWSSYQYKTFDNKAEAIEFSNKGLKTIKPKVDKYITTLIDLQKKLLLIQTNCEKDDTFETMMATPKNTTEKDILIKIDYKNYRTQTIPEADETSITKIKKFITPEIAILNNDTLLDHKECNPRSFPIFIKYEYLNKAKERLKFKATKRLLEDIKYQLPHLEELKKFLEKYEPFKKINGIDKMWFNEKYIKDFVRDVKEITTKLMES